jgi:predicted O-linked N-acetylglucosamine transferase (SPINDLY family)
MAVNAMPQVTIQHAFDMALRHHQAGRLREAEMLYRQILAQQPEYANAIHNLGMIAHQVGQNDAALDLIRRALALDPNIAEAHCNLGNALTVKGQLDEAAAAYRRAIALRPNYADAHSNLGNALKDKGRLDDAIVAYRHAIDLNPGYAEVHYNLGNALRDKGQIEDAAAAYRNAIALKPGFPEAYNNLGNALKDKGQLDEAVAAYREAIALNPNFREAFNNLGNALKDQGQLDEAIVAYRQAIVLSPNYADGHYNLGSALRDKGQIQEAAAAFREAIALRTDFPEAYNNLGNALKDLGQLDDAVAAYRKAVTFRPRFPEADNNLGIALSDKAQLDEAIATFRHAIDLNPSCIAADSNLVYTLHFHPDYDARAIAQEHRRWDRQHASPLQVLGGPHFNDRSPNRRLRIGYVSPDFKGHVVGQNILPLFQQCNRGHFEIFSYAQVSVPDAITSQFQQLADGWRNIVGLSDDQVATQIREDRVDILVDLTLHMAHNRLLVFARKPAPIQVTFAGYPGSTGLSAIDYRLSDPYLDPPGMDESVYSEQTIRLPDSFWCYDPQDGRDIPVNSLPALETGVVTFGCLNKFSKVNKSILSRWKQVLRQVENARLLLMASQGSHRQQTLDWLCQDGIDPERIEFVPRQTRQAYLALYHRIDLGLDSFPYNGHTTSLDSYWMGVPVVTLVGQTAVSRAGWCQLSNLGLPELAGQTPEQFVQIAVELARDLPRLRDLRATLRQRLEQSPLMDAAKFTRSIEAAYRQMWRSWCETGSDRIR